MVAEADGVLSIKVAEGEMAAIGAVFGTLDSAGAAQAAAAPVVPPPEDAKAEALERGYELEPEGKDKR